MFLNLPINPKAPAPLKGFSYNFIRPYLTSLSFYWYLVQMQTQLVILISSLTGRYFLPRYVALFVIRSLTALS